MHSTTWPGETESQSPETREAEARRLHWIEARFFVDLEDDQVDLVADLGRLLGVELAERGDRPEAVTDVHEHVVAAERFDRPGDAGLLGQLAARSGFPFCDCRGRKVGAPPMAAAISDSRLVSRLLGPSGISILGLCGLGGFRMPPRLGAGDAGRFGLGVLVDAWRRATGLGIELAGVRSEGVARAQAGAAAGFSRTRGVWSWYRPIPRRPGRGSEAGGRFGSRHGVSGGGRGEPVRRLFVL